MSAPRRQNDNLQERVVMLYSHGAFAADGSEVLFKAKGKFLVTSAQLVNRTGLAASATDYFDVRLEKTGAVLVANWSTQDTADGALVAETFADMNLSAVAGALVLEANQTLSLVADETGDTTLPPGLVQIEGRYL